MNPWEKRTTAGVYLSVRTPGDSTSVPHLPVLNKLGPRTQPGSIRKVLIQECSCHGWNHQGTRTLWTPEQEIKSIYLQFFYS